MEIGDRVTENGVELTVVAEKIKGGCSGCHYSRGICMHTGCKTGGYILLSKKGPILLYAEIKIEVEKAVKLLTNADNRKNPELVEVLNNLLENLTTAE